MLRRRSLVVIPAAAIAAWLALGTTQPAAAQVQRNFPAHALRGTLAFEAPPQALLNGKPAQLAPGARIRGENNLLVLSSALMGSRHVVHYTLDPLGLLMDIWLLRDDELRSFWPRSAAEAERHLFDPMAQTWTRK